MTKQGWLFFLRPPRSRCAPGFKRARPLCPYNTQAPSFYTSFKSKHRVLHHSCFGQIRVTILILIFVIIHPGSSQIVLLAMSLCISSHRISTYAEPYLCRKEHRLFLCAGVGFQGSELSPESLCAIKGSSELSALNIDLLSCICQQVNSKQAHQWLFKSVTALSLIREEKKEGKKRLVMVPKHSVK